MSPEPLDFVKRTGYQHQIEARRNGGWIGNEESPHRGGGLGGEDAWAGLFG